MIQSSKDPHLASGLVVLDGTPRLVRVPSPLLALDALSYLRWSRDSDLDYAEIYEMKNHPDYEYDEFAASIGIYPPTAEETRAELALAVHLRAEARGADLILDRGRWVEGAEVSPLLRARCVVEPLAVVDRASAALYAARLIEQDLGGAEQMTVEWLYAEDDDGWHLDVAPRLVTLKRHAGPYVRARCVDRLGAC